MKNIATTTRQNVSSSVVFSAVTSNLLLTLLGVVSIITTQALGG